MGEFKYSAFISYSHQDTRAAAWLQRSIESYRLPANLAETNTGVLRSSGRFRRVFRDRDELPAGRDLGESIRKALEDSEFLIVVCSPASAQSHWVGLEIEEFRKTHNASRILSIVVDGEPLASTTLGDVDSECFHPALGYGARGDDGADVYEPVAADLRQGRDGRRLARLKIIAGLLGVGLDALVQRDTQRRQKRMLAFSTASFIGMVVMTVLSFMAIDARNDEQLRRAEAEDLIEFMLGDLRDRLDAVGRLDVLDSVGEKAIEYYSRTELSDHNDAALGRRARAFHLLGEVDDLRGDMDAARAQFEEAYNSTAELIRRSPNNQDLIFDHAQSVFWVGYLDWRLGDLDAAEQAFSEYLTLADRLVEMDPENADWQIELASANLNLGVYSQEIGQPSASIPYFKDALTIFETALALDPNLTELRWEIAQSHAWLADAYESDRSLDMSSAERRAESEIYQAEFERNPDDQNLKLSLMSSLISRADIAMQQGDIDTATTLLLEARVIAGELRRLDAENTFTLEQSASIAADLAEARWFSDDIDGAREYFDEADEITAGLIRLDTAVSQWRVLRQTIRLQRAKFLIGTGTGDTVEILALLSLTLDDLQDLLAEGQQSTKVTHLYAEANFLMGEAHRNAGSAEQANRYYASAVERLAASEVEIPLRPLALLGRAYRASGQAEEADRIDALLNSAGFRHPEHAEYSFDVAP